jgi:diacylglycerol kinase
MTTTDREPSSSPPSPSSSASAPPPTPSLPRHGLIASFRFAFAGIGYLFRTQRNARIHFVLAILACLLAALLRIPRHDWAILLLTIACVIILEGLNTAIEAVVDLASPQIHPLAKIAKDVTAGMVLIAAIASVGVGLLIFGPPLWALVAR